jgi:hypothetical protein
MTVYSKTMAGRMVAFDQLSGLTPALKDFLKLVDGKTPPDQLVAQWRDGTEALQMLQELEIRGLIEVRAVRWSHTAGNSAFSSSFTDSTPPASAPAPQKMARTPAPVELAAIKEQMATFMLTHLPHHAVTVLKEIEEIDSYDRLMHMLTAYAHLAHDAGRIGLAHIKSLRAMMEPEFESTAH